jgi:hypothetical protein
MPLFCLGSLSLSTQAATTSWWRFEAGSDTDPSAAGLVNANEVAGEPAMVSANATLGTNAPDLFDDFIPSTGDTNTGSVRSFVNGAGTDGIFGSAAYSSTLDSRSITVEFWVRTTESEAGFVARTTDPDQSGESGSLDNGFRIIDPDNVTVEYWVSRNDGTDEEFVSLVSGEGIADGEWHYIAFRYNNSNGLGELIIDNVVVASDNGPNNRRLWYGDPGNDEPGVHIGYRMDGDPLNQTGTLDEIRFSDTSLPDEELLVVPEGTAFWPMALLSAGVLFGLARRSMGGKSPRTRDAKAPLA